MSCPENLDRKDIVLMAYKLILGREPENDNALNRHFTDYQDLRQQFMNSEEFKQIISEHKGSESNQIIGIIDIAEIYSHNKNQRFLWCINNDATDLVSNNARKGNISIEPSLSCLFTTKGTFLDIGANIGAFCLSFAADGWNGYAFEASSKNAFALKSSIALNGFDIQVIESAVWEKTGKIYFMQQGPYGLVKNDLMLNAQYEEIDCITLDDWIVLNNDIGIERIDFIKIDIEGSEVAALRGMRHFLESYGYPPIFIEGNAFTLCLQGETIYSMLSLANSMGYRVYEFSERGLHTVDEKRIPKSVVTDFLLIKNFDSSLSFSKSDIYEEPKLSDEEILTQVIKQLSNYNEWEHYDPYICYALKDYPTIHEHPEINKLLTEISQEKDRDLFLSMAISWFTERRKV